MFLRKWKKQKKGETKVQILGKNNWICELKCKAQEDSSLSGTGGVWKEASRKKKGKHESNEIGGRKY